MSELPPLVLVAAMAKNRVIGNAGQLPWHEPEDLKHFRNVTINHAVIMGRKTFDVLGKPLPKRRNIVVTRKMDWSAEGCQVRNDLGAAITLARREDTEPRIIGGGEIYLLALPLATRIYLTVIDVEPLGDAYFPLIDENDWMESECRVSSRLTFRTLDRRSRH